jgi:hypothetical protein
VAQVVERLPSKCEALSSKAVLPKKKKKEREKSNMTKAHITDSVSMKRLEKAK